MTDASSGATLFDRQYTYNAANQIASITDLTNSRTFGYDFVDRLKTVTAFSPPNEFYNFDDVGNRTSSHRSATYGYQSGKFNQLSSTAAATYGYDANGNMASKSEGSNFWRYTWDNENRLIQASTRKQAVRYRYDALGRRVQRYTAGSRENIKFINDAQDVLLDDDSGTLTKYLNGPGIDNKLRVQNGSTVNYFLSDHLGSTNGLADSTGNLTSQTAYDSFGKQIGILSTRYGFTGRERDDFSGLMYYRARFYDPNLGRFISEDPIGFRGGDINLYGYVRNNSITFRDPTGKIIPIIAIGIGVGAAALIFSSPSYVNAPGPGDSVYDSRSPLVANALLGAGIACGLRVAGGSLWGAVTSRFFKSGSGVVGNTADDFVGAPFKPFTKRNFRDNLGQQTGQIPPNSHAHHALPDEFADDFFNAGINHNNPQYGGWWEAGSHLKNAQQYNQEWREFLRPGRTSQEILDFGREIMNRYGIPVNF